MFKKWIAVLVTGSLSCSIFAADSEDMSKDNWLGKLNEAVPAMICKNYIENEGVNKQLIAAGVTYEKCVSLIPASFEKCKTQYYSQIPEVINSEVASKWGNTLGECIGMDFATTHLSPNAQTPAQTTGSSMTKDEWFSKLRVVVPALMCKGFLEDASLKDQLTKKSIDYDKCVTLIPASMDKCQTEIYTEIPGTIDSSKSDKWGNTFGECIGKDFAIKYLM